MGEGKKFTLRELHANCWVCYPHIKEDEVMLAIQIMEHDGDNVAYFGVNGYFLYSEYDKSVGGVQ